jgi:hypothetical protein
MQRAISAVESNRVPSQSKAMRSKRRTRVMVASRSVAHSAGSGRLQGDAFAAGRVVEGQFARVQEHAREALLAAGQLAVEREVAVLRVADDRVPGMRQVHADLVRAAGLEVTSSSVKAPPRAPTGPA